MVAGPYGLRTGDPAGRRANLLRLQEAARAVYAKGHHPVIGLNLFLDLGRPLWDQAIDEGGREGVNRISLELAARCDAVLRIGRSGGADAEAEVLRTAGKPVYESIEEVPVA